MAVLDYELILMLDPEAADDAREKVAADAKAKLEAKGEIKNEANWGMRKMAYEIDRRGEADYRVWRFTGGKDLLDDLDHTLKITDGVLRFRIFKVPADSPNIVPPDTEQVMRRDEDERDRADEDARKQQSSEVAQPRLRMRRAGGLQAHDDQDGDRQPDEQPGGHHAPNSGAGGTGPLGRGLHRLGTGGRVEGRVRLGLPGRGGLRVELRVVRRPSRGVEEDLGGLVEPCEAAVGRVQLGDLGAPRRPDLVRGRVGLDVEEVVPAGRGRHHPWPPVTGE